MKRVFVFVYVLVLSVGSLSAAARSFQERRSEEFQKSQEQLALTFAMQALAVGNYPNLTSIIATNQRVLSVLSFDGKTLLELAQERGDEQAVAIICAAISRQKNLLRKSPAIRGESLSEQAFDNALSYFNDRQYTRLEAILWKFPALLVIETAGGKTLQQLAEEAQDVRALDIIDNVENEQACGVAAECGRRASF
ncbi:hypothetical protein K2X40_00130 [Candidatus Babeliales bacterium]|nr:hypothetical protein [Candidatus Babeliales bacterium]